MNDWSIFEAASGAMELQRAELDIAARNIALAQTADGTHRPARLIPRYESVPSSFSDDVFSRLAAGGSGDFAIDSPPESDDDDDDAALEAFGAIDDVRGMRRIAAVEPDRSPHGEVDALTEMVNVLDHQRAYEANASVFDAGKRVAERTIDVIKQ